MFRQFHSNKTIHVPHDKKSIGQSMEYSLVFMAYAMGCFVIPLLGKKKRLHLDPPNEKGKLQ